MQIDVHQRAHFQIGVNVAQVIAEQHDEDHSGYEQQGNHQFDVLQCVKIGNVFHEIRTYFFYVVLFAQVIVETSLRSLR